MNSLSNQLDNGNNVLVSIICLTYNHQDYIRETLNSFISQETNFRFEVLVGEDKSTDDTSEIVDEYCENYPNIIKKISSEKNVGMNANFSRVLAACKGRYIAMCEGDDYWTDTKKLQKQVDFLEKNESYVGCYHNFSIKNEDSIETQKKQFPDSIDILAMSKRVAPIQTLTVMFRNVGVELLPNHLHQKVTGTYFIFLKLSEYGAWKYLDEDMAIYRIHQGGVWSGKKNYEKALMALDNLDAMCHYHIDNVEVSINLNRQYRERCAYFIMFFLLRFKMSWSIRMLSLYKKNRKGTFLFQGALSYPKELFKAIVNRFY